MEGQNSGETIMAALLTLHPHQFSDLRVSLLSDFRRQNHRLASLLHSSTRFSLTLQHLQSLSLHDKTILIARYLLTTLKLLTCPWEPQTLPSPSGGVRFRDMDAVLLLMLLCEVHQHDSQALDNSPTEWRHILNHYVVFNNMLTMTGIGVTSNVALSSYVDVVTKCRRFLDAAGCSHGEKVGREVAAAVAVVVALPSVELCGGGGGEECVVCKEEMREGRDVCELPCEHLFHWMCILPWLKKRNTCPCCRFQLPTDDLFGEIDRLWGILVRMSTTTNANLHWDLCGGQNLSWIIMRRCD